MSKGKTKTKPNPHVHDTPAGQQCHLPADFPAPFSQETGSNFSQQTQMFHSRTTFLSHHCHPENSSQMESKINTPDISYSVLAPCWKRAPVASILVSEQRSSLMLGLCDRCELTRLDINDVLQNLLP